METRKTITLILITTAAVIVAVHMLRTDRSPDRVPEALPDTVYLEEGKRLSEQYCTGCHIYPDPGLLPKRTWISETLPAMGPILGIFSHNGETYPLEQTPYLPQDHYPSEPLLNEEEWQRILDFYEQAAPERLSRPENLPDIVRDTIFFKPRIPPYRTGTPPMVTAVRFDPANRLIYFSDSGNETFNIFDVNLNISGSFSAPAMSDIRILNEHHPPGLRDLLLTYLGDINPSDALHGAVGTGRYDLQNRHFDTNSLLVDRIARPVETLAVDLNRNGRKDLLVSEFGHRKGKLFWLENLGDGEYSGKNVLINTPGCIQSHVMDYTNNGLPDIVTLCTQLDQAIYLLRNMGEGSFEKQTLIRFSVTAGSSSFELHDFTGNGHHDILYTSGDNADFSKVYKSYHGVYIYLNDGDDNFEEAWFYPIHGAYNAKARDFTGDGNPDIAAISFFADYVNRPEEGFVFFKNEGYSPQDGLSFTPYHHHPTATHGRWLVMDVADWTGNGRDDILLGNFSLGPTRVIAPVQNLFTQGPPFLLLENMSGERR